MGDRTAGIILAAGLSTRMGQLKQLLPIGGQPAVCRVAAVLLAHLPRVVAVVGHRGREVAAPLQAMGVECVHNERYRQGMSTSVQCAVRHLGPGWDYAICLGDQPALRGSTLVALLAARERTRKGIVLPRYQGRRGHPVLIAGRYFERILGLAADRGLRAITRGYPEDALEVDVDAPEILCDMDTPADYRRERARAREERE